ncbi:MAG: hypothetical protein ACPGJS_15325 [Flammeovirgaceae bacterium]
MKFDDINKALEEIIDLRNQVYQLNHGDAHLQTIEARLGELESELLSNYGTQLHEVLLDVHDELCPDNDVLSPTNYIASFYHVQSNGSDKKYDVDTEAGVLVQMDDFPQQPTRLVLVPSPLRVVLNVNHTHREEVWSAANNVAAY